ncbi:MAG: DNA gyrase subunit A, partial [Planctomycetes bacterium]|nr:DNA gyrase subunit A [Planctomycetota bacterium]
IRQDLIEVRDKHGDERRTEISGQEVGEIDIGDLIAEEAMVVTISHSGYIKRTAASTYRAQRRGGKGLMGAKTEEEDPIEHLFVASSHDYLLFFTNQGKVYWQKVYDLPQLGRESRGRALVNLLRFGEGEMVADCLAIRDFKEPGRFLMMATRRGLVKKTPLADYGRPLKGGIIAIKLKEDDELVDVVVTGTGEEVLLATASGMAIRFNEADARPMGRNTSGVTGVRLRANDHLVGMVVADPESTLLTACQNGYGKRTPFGPGGVPEGEAPPDAEGPNGETAEPTSEAVSPEAEAEEGEEAGGSGQRYRTQRRGGKGVRDIKTSQRNGPVVSVVSVRDEDEVLMISARGKIQRVAASDVSVIGRNTQGVRIMSLDEGDTLAAIVRVPHDAEAEDGTAALPEPGEEAAE